MPSRIFIQDKGTSEGYNGIKMKINRAERRSGAVLKENIMGGLTCLTFPALAECGLVEHLFTTRLGGVSEGIYASMNLSFSRGDDKEHVLENYRRVAEALGCKREDMVATRQTHTTNIRVVTAKDKGKGVVRPADYEDIDGLVTDEPGIVLAAFYADCVPLYFVDTKHGAIGLAHSGWRGTVKQMGARMVETMGREFGTGPEELLAAIGPSICQECYEVDEAVAQEFAGMLQGSEEILEEIRESGRYFAPGAPRRQVVEKGRAEGKYQLDLWLANLIILRRAGIPLPQISVTDICTCHNPDYLFSHRASQGKRGNLGAFLMLKNN